jgi:hypothetical protein
MQERFSLLSSGICKYTHFGKKTKSISVSCKSVKNLSKRVSFKSLSPNSAKKVKSIISHWVIGIKLTQKQQYGTGKHFKNYLIMITLTLPCKQIESDKVVKSKYLNLFLQKLRNQIDDFNYLWVAEKQGNGNIHFHLIVDKYFKKEYIQKLWNETLANGEYINKFQHKFGHRMPPSTKITGQHGMKDASEYLTKYVTKSEKSDLIEGKAWDCSDNLLKIKSICFVWKDIYYKLIECDFYKLDMKYISSEFRELFVFKEKFVNSFLQSELFYEIEDFLRESLSVVFNSLRKVNLVKENLVNALFNSQLQFAY